MRSAPFNPNFYYNRRLHPRFGRGGIGGLVKVALLGSLVWVISKKVVMSSSARSLSQRGSGLEGS
ncbi:hypothetical protein BDV30DRAFT_208735 [Aspergillus minisclerotigenes]|uniref:Uncharacterized protein n=1 Tax=Aspergillus minisclerotigenes TaxID=656917 RepID=A0A5N6J9B8_9EURO|nr:hypothetical protein BDV30DRAFT_208735 [Aspergillus minisclerotigenes]